MLRYAIALTALTLPAAAFAHGSTTPKHGGKMVIDGETQVELAPAKDGGSDIFVSEEDVPHEATGLEGSAVIKDQPDSKVALVPAEANRLHAPGFAPAAGQAVVVTVIDKATGMKTFATFQY